MKTAEPKPQPSPARGRYLAGLAERIDRGGLSSQVPKRRSFRDFLTKDARVPIGGGRYGPYTFAGREALGEIVDVIDKIHSCRLADARVVIAGGAQFGKSILELNFAAYVVSQLWRNFGLYLPDDDLVQGMVDTKFRPDVVDQIEWFAQLTQIGKGLNRSGKQVNRKGAFLVTDGTRTSSGMIRGLGKVPTTFSMDVAAMDEVDDIEPRMAKFVEGRLTASDLRLILKIGTQRVHGRGQNKAWKDGSQGVVHLRCGACRREWNPEEEFPGIVRLQVGRVAHHADPKLTHAGDFRRGDAILGGHEPGNTYHLACPECGEVLDRSKPFYHHRQPDKIRAYEWSFRISQLSIGAIELGQIVRAWVEALGDPEKMVVFRCDRLALPKSSTQAITPEILDRARTLESFDLAPPRREGTIRVAGLDTGDRCWFVAREIPGQGQRCRKRIVVAEQLPSSRLIERGEKLCAIHGIDMLCIDQRPEVTNARALALRLNGLEALSRWPAPPGNGDCHLSLGNGITFRRDGGRAQWRGIRCALVSFAKRALGAGIEHDLDVFDGPNGRPIFVPLLVVNRYETIDRAVREFLIPSEGVQEIVGGVIRQEPGVLLPIRRPGSPPILQLLDEHLLAGSEREKEADGSSGDYVDQCENHLLLANAYSALSEMVAPNSRRIPTAAAGVANRRSGGRIVGF